MQFISPEQVHSALAYPKFIDALSDSFASTYTMPARQVLALDEAEDNRDAFALLPAWDKNSIGLKCFAYMPDNEAPYDPLYAQVLLFDRKHGFPKALVDGISVTLLRTAGVSGLASRYLSRENSERMVLLGTGKLAPYLIRAHASVRKLKTIEVWGRNTDKAQAVVDEVQADVPDVELVVCKNLEASCREADIVVAATGSHDPLIHGEWLKPGAYVDCLGNHHADGRECDTETVTRSRVFVDTKANCFKEAGEILLPVEEGKFSLDEVAGELSDLCRGTVTGRENDEQVTFFKSVGCALGDLCGAATAFEESKGVELGG
ncbi:MAG: ornithine cyclodeaminase family protein [Akkermansiaceae bacterium]|nr:ornithine cyclodeaminase family protein [Akkermansiaceae bacterium]